MLANSVDPDECGIICHVKNNPRTEKEIQFYLEIKTYDPSINTMDHSKVIVSRSIKLEERIH